MDIRRTRTCERCKTQVPLQLVKLFPRNNDQSWIVCEPCCDELKHRSNPGPTLSIELPKQPMRNIPTQRDVDQPSPSFEMKREPVRNQYAPRVPQKPIDNVMPSASTSTLKRSGLNEPRLAATAADVPQSFSKMVEHQQNKPLPKLMNCVRCDYTFAVDPEKVGVSFKLRCPYCGRDDRLVKP